ncbi:hypothetical protein N9I03_07225, partial [Gammaproteobacteria bacterium]|nr:hypothetical protein [Gammaproteobacteria bacterium]
PVQEDPRDSVVFTQPVQTAQAFQRGPVEQERKREDILFTDKYNTTEERNEPDENEEDIINVPGSNQGQTPNVGDTYTLPNGNVLVWNGTGYVLQTKGTDIVGETQLTDEQLKAKFESERRARMVEAGQSAEDIVAGTADLNLPTAEVQRTLDKRPEETDEEYQSRIASYEAEAIQLGDAKGVKAVKVDPTDAEEVVTMEAEKAAVPEGLDANTYTAKEVDTSVDVEAAEGEVQEDKLAKAAQVDRAAPIEGADVDIPEGALAERVIGKISEGAKATAVMNAGSSLSRITRAKKQLSRAGLSDTDIQEIGNDPEALEDRLEDFSEEQRGIIEGLPEEALVSTQINGLLEGMENGEIPVWAKPAVAQVEQMLAKRGMSASTVGRDNLFNAIIQSAMPIAQSNAQAIQQSVSQQKTIEAQEAEANAARGQQTALTNAQNVFNMDMAQFNADQQTAISNSKFMQTVAITEANNDQQAAIQNAVITSQANIAEADFYQKTQINNANAFLQMDLTNLNNKQQANVVKAQQEQQRILSNQSATNAAKQFNSASENQTQQFMAGLEAQINQFNVAQINASEQFNTQSQNAANAREAQRTADVNKANASILNRVNEFNAQLDFNREQWNAANQQAILSSNVDWRRKANLADTAAQNEVNRQNVQNAFGLTQAAQSFLWQELRDQADYDFKWATDTANRKLNAMIAAAGSEGDAAKNWSTNFNNASSTVDRIFGET